MDMVLLQDIVNNNEPCPTPDCDSMLAKIAIYDDKGNRLKEVSNILW